MSNLQVWRSAQERLRQQMTPAQFKTWLHDTWLAASADGATTLCVRTTFAKEQLETRFRDRIAAAIGEVTGKPCDLRIEVAKVAADIAAVSGEAEAQTQRAASALPRGVSAAAAHRPPHAPRRGHDGSSMEPAHSLFEVSTEEPQADPLTMPAASRTVNAGGEREGRAAAAAQESAQKRVITMSTQRRRPTPAIGNAVAGRNERVRAAVERSRGVETQQPRQAPETRPAMARQDGRFGGDATNAYAPSVGSAPATTEIQETPMALTDTVARYAGGGAERTPMRSEKIGGSTAMSGYKYPRDDDGRNAYREMPANVTRANENQTEVPRLNQRYTFATFIVGSSNQFAHASSLAVAEAPGHSYNPLFLYGGVGLGKTHLLHAIGHTAIEHGLAVLYVSSETFTNEIINAIRYRTTEEFRAKYRSVDVLLVDDIQFIAGKESTEEEFFHTFNSLHDTSKQIVICSDRPPKAMISLQERLRSRFEWGLIADIQPPDLETRVAILRTKAEGMGRKVSDDVINYIASRVQSNIRELEGTFNRFFAFAQLQHLPLNIDTAKAALTNLAADGRQRRVTVPEILNAVAEFYRIPKEDLCGKQRDKHIVVPRQIAMFLMRQETEASLLEIGQALGGRDHSTVLHGCEKIGREVNENTTMRKEVMAIRQQLMGKE